MALPAENPNAANHGPRTPRILLAEDDYEMRRFLGAALRKDGYEVIEAKNGNRLLDQLGEHLIYGAKFDIDLIVSDVRMPGVDGLEVLASLTMYDNPPPVILITAFGDRQLHADAARFGAFAVIDKPFDISELRAVIRRIALPPSETRSMDEGSSCN